MLEIHEQFYFEKWLVLTGFLNIKDLSERQTGSATEKCIQIIYLFVLSINEKINEITFFLKLININPS